MASVAEAQSVAECAGRARAAQRAFAGFSQEQVEYAVAGVAWAGYSHAETLARLAIEDTGIGNYDDKVAKNRRKTLGTMRDLKGARSVGTTRTDPARGITEIAKPVGIVGVLTLAKPVPVTVQR